MRNTFTWFAMLLLAAASARGSGSVAAPTPMAPGSPQLETIEEATESLANRLLDLAGVARAGQAEAVAPFLARRIRLRLPVTMGARTTAWRLLDTQAFDLTARVEPMSRDKAASAIQHVLDRFREIDHVGFELEDAQTRGGSPDSLAARFRFSIVGRDTQGRREWLRGGGTLAARRAPGPWTLDALVFDEAASLVASRDLFTEISVPAGVARQDPSFMERGARGLIGHGAAVADVDADGLIDVFAAGLTSNALFRNKGDGTFEDVARTARVDASAAPGQSPLFLDYDGDGDQDLFLSAVGRQSLFQNRLVPDGRLTFRDVSTQARVDVDTAGFSALAGDVNGDGRPDIYVACYNRYGDVVPDSWDRATNGLPNLLFINGGDGTFREAGKELGVADSRWSYAAQFADVDDDSDLDLYVANDFGGPDGLFLNDVKDSGRFRDAAAERGVGEPGYSMGVSFGDIDLDGDLDLHVTRMSSTAGKRTLARLDEAVLPGKLMLQSLASGNAVFENTGGGRYREISRIAGPFPGGWGWGGGFFDADNDGFPDLYVPNGFLSGTAAKDTESLFWRQVVASKVETTRSVMSFFERQVGLFQQGFSFSGHERDLVLLNRGNGTFLDASGASGLDSITDGRGAVFADFDNDGDTDVFLRAMHDRSHLLFRNDVGHDVPSFRVALEGRASGHDAFGAVVRARTHAGTPTQVKAGGSGFLSQSDPRLLFGLGNDDAAEWLEVSWPSGLKQRFAGPRAGDSWLLVEGEPGPRRVSERRFALPDPPGTSVKGRGP